MNTNELIQKNIENLTQLFTLMGAKQEDISNGKKLHLSDAWPNRLWMPYNYNSEDLEEAINLDTKKEKSHVISLWEYNEEIFHKAIKTLDRQEYKVLFEQIGMCLDLEKTTVTQNDDFRVDFATSADDISLWSNIASLSFGGVIDEKIISKISKDKNISLLLGYKNDVAVSTTLLYENSGVVGVHLVGVPIEHRSQGIAENMMKKAICLSKEKNLNLMVLQASTLGLGIYTRLGFKENFLLRNYIK